MRFANIVADVESRINNSSITTRVKQWINNAQDEVQVFFDWP